MTGEKRLLSPAMEKCIETDRIHLLLAYSGCIVSRCFSEVVLEHLDEVSRSLESGLLGDVRH